MKRGVTRFAVLVALAASASAGIVDDVRARLAQNDVSGAAGLVQNYRRARGVTAEMLEADSWIARGELGRKNLAEAEKYAQETYSLSVAELKKRPLGRDPNAPLALALGAAI